MKNHNRTQLLTLFSGLCVLAAPALLVAAAVPPPDAMLVAAAAADDTQTTVTGKVDSKSDHSIQVDGQAVLVTESTVFVRKGGSAALADIQPGDEVRATCAKAADGSLLAVRIEVTTPAS